MPTVELNGTTLYYETHGVGSDIVLIHGFGDSAALWQPQFEGLENYFRLTAIDIRGHARSGAPTDLGLYTQDQVVEDLRAIMDVVGIKKAIIGGHSLGGYTSMRFYQRYPDRVQALILSGTGPGYRKMEGAKGWTLENEKVAKKFEERGLATIIDARAEKIGRHGGDVPIYHLSGGLMYVRLGIMRMPPLVECTEIDVPTLVLVGERDTAFRNASDYMATRIPNGQGPVVIPGASHWCNFDDPKAWNAAVLQFINNL